MSIEPATLRIVHFPHPALREKAVPVEEVTDNVRDVATRIIELMHAAPGIGLAAPQVGVPWRLFVVQIPQNSVEPDEEIIAGDTIERTWATDGAKVYINPEIHGYAGDLWGAEEGCLSLPDITGEVRRPELATISYTDLNGRACTEHGAGLLARCWQHEADHLDGVLIIDKMTQLSRLRTRSAIKALQKNTKSAGR